MKIKLNPAEMINWILECNGGGIYAATSMMKCIATYGENTVIDVTNFRRTSDAIWMEEFNFWLERNEYIVVEADPEITVTITGNNTVGKTALMQFMAQACDAAGFKINIDYGSDGKPQRNSQQRIDAINNIVQKGTVVNFVEKYGNVRKCEVNVDEAVVK